MFDQFQNSLELLKTQTIQNLTIIGYILAVLWGVFLISCFFKPILYLGIIPRRLRGLPGIVFSPLLHLNFNHIFFNTIPLVVLANFILLQGIPFFIVVTVAITLMSGFLTWCFGKSGLHIGASSVVTGYWALLISDIFQQGTFMAIVLGAVSFYYFAGILLGLLPGKKDVSWEGHLFGLISGFAVSWFMARFAYAFVLS